jgi:hypothetical protein
VGNYLYYSADIWRFTLLWTLIIFGIFYMATAAVAVGMHVGRGKRSYKWVWIIPVGYAAIAGVEALLAGSFIGLMYDDDNSFRNLY